MSARGTKCIFNSSVASSPDETATTVSHAPGAPAVVANLSVSAVEPAAMLSAGTTAGPCFTDPTDPAGVNSVSQTLTVRETVTATSSRQRIAVTDNLVSRTGSHPRETAAAVRVQALQITVAAGQSNRLHKNHAKSATGTISSSHNRSMG